MSHKVADNLPRSLTVPVEVVLKGANGEDALKRMLYIDGSGFMNKGKSNMCVAWFVAVQDKPKEIQPRAPGNRKKKKATSSTNVEPTKSPKLSVTHALKYEEGAPIHIRGKAFTWSRRSFFFMIRESPPQS